MRFAISSLYFIRHMSIHSSFVILLQRICRIDRSKHTRVVKIIIIKRGDNRRHFSFTWQSRRLVVSMEYQKSSRILADYHCCHCCVSVPPQQRILKCINCRVKNAWYGLRRRSLCVLGNELKWISEPATQRAYKSVRKSSLTATTVTYYPRSKCFDS